MHAVPVIPVDFAFFAVMEAVGDPVLLPETLMPVPLIDAETPIPMGSHCTEFVMAARDLADVAFVVNAPQPDGSAQSWMYAYAEREFDAGSEIVFVLLFALAGITPIATSATAIAAMLATFAVRLIMSCYFPAPRTYGGDRIRVRTSIALEAGYGLFLPDRKVLWITLTVLPRAASMSDGRVRKSHDSPSRDAGPVIERTMRADV
jgi:hypothetical protein